MYGRGRGRGSKPRMPSSAPREPLPPADIYPFYSGGIPSAPKLPLEEETKNLVDAQLLLRLRMGQSVFSVGKGSMVKKNRRETLKRLKSGIVEDVNLLPEELVVTEVRKKKKREMLESAELVIAEDDEEEEENAEKKKGSDDSDESGDEPQGSASEESDSDGDYAVNYDSEGDEFEDYKENDGDGDD